MNTAFVGFSANVVPDWQNYLPEPHAPSNYKDPDKITEYIEAARDKQAAEANRFPLTGVIDDVFILAGNSASDVRQVHVDLKSVPLATYLSNYHRIACLEANTLLRLARLDFIAKHGSLTEETLWLAFPELSSRFSKPFVFDPVTRLIGSEAKEATDPWLVARRFLGCDEKKYDLHYTGVRGRAGLAVELSKLLGC